MHDLYILRHGETTWNREGRMQGHLNAPLTDLGQAQAAAQGAVLAQRDLRGFAFYSSPLARAVHTAGLARRYSATSSRDAFQILTLLLPSGLH